MSASWSNLTPRPDKGFSEPEKAHFSWRLVLTPALSCEREQHLNDKQPSALIERESTNCRCYWVCRCLVATEQMQHPNTLCGVRVLGLKEEPDIGKLCPQKQTSGLPVGGLIWDTTCLRVNILNFSHMTEWFNRRRSKIRHNPPSFFGTMIFQPHYITIIIGGGDEGAGWKRSCQWSRHLGVEIGEERQAPCWRWSLHLQKAFIQSAYLLLSLLIGWPVDL